MRGFRLGQIVSGSLFSLSHGTNDEREPRRVCAAVVYGIAVMLEKK